MKRLLDCHVGFKIITFLDVDLFLSPLHNPLANERKLMDQNSRRMRWKPLYYERHSSSDTLRRFTLSTHKVSVLTSNERITVSGGLAAVAALN